MKQVLEIVKEAKGKDGFETEKARELYQTYVERKNKAHHISEKLVEKVNFLARTPEERERLLELYSGRYE